MKMSVTLTFYLMKHKVRVSLVLANVFKITLANLDFIGQVKNIFTGKLIH
jgi:hypothetical protein